MNCPQYDCCQNDDRRRNPQPLHGFDLCDLFKKNKSDVFHFISLQNNLCRPIGTAAKKLMITLPTMA
jgi:hypothetical protein